MSGHDAVCLTGAQDSDHSCMGPLPPPFAFSALSRDTLCLPPPLSYSIPFRCNAPTLSTPSLVACRLCRQGMEWTEVKQEQLHRFLEAFTSPDPAVQALNLEQLQALSHHPSALVSTLAIVCDATVSVTVRLSATTVARQLMHCSDRLPLYLSATGKDPTTAVQSIAETLFDAALGDSSSLSSATAAAPLQRATSNLIACLLSGLAHTSLASTATAVWSRIISSLLHRTDPAMCIVSDAFEGGRRHTPQHECRCAALLRVICEGPLSTSKVLREWVGGQAAESLALCSLFSQLLQLLERQMETDQAASGAVARFNALCLEETLAGFRACMESGVLPCGPSDFSSASASDHPAIPSGTDSGSTSLGEGPAAQALRVVGTAVLSVQSAAQGLILRHVLGRLEILDSQRADSVFLHEAVVVAAPFVAVGMRYMADAVALNAIAPLHSAFHTTVTPLLARFCRAACLAELQYDNAGESDSVHAAVLACVNYMTEWMNAESARLRTPSIHLAAPSAHPSTVTASADGYVSCLYSMLVDAATLPSSVADGLVEHTTHHPDSAAEFLVKSATGRRRGPRGSHTPKTYDGWASIAVESAEGTENASAEVPAKCDDEEEDTLRADALEVALPDNGTLRQAVAWCALSLSCQPEWLMAIAPFVARPVTILPPSSLAAACTVESILFMTNEVLDGILADDKVSASLAAATPELLEENLAEQLQSILSLFSPLTQGDLGTRAPFFVRIQAVRYLGRLVVGLLNAWQHTFGADHVAPSRLRIVERTHRVMLTNGGLEKLLDLVLGCLITEVNKAAQVECVKTLNSTLTSCLKVMNQLMRSPVNDEDASDLEEESLDSTSTSSSGGKNAGEGDEEAAGHLLHSDHCERARVFCQSFGATTHVRAIVEVLRVISSHLPSFQWSVRQGVYHLFSEVLPSLWQTAPLVDSLFARPADGTDSLASYSARLVTAQVLEMLAQHYTELLRISSLSDNASPMLEMATLLTSMADVASAMDGGALEMVVPWILQVAHHMLNLYAHYLTRRAHSNHSPIADSAGRVVDMTDMCMVTLDLVSCVCDGVIDRDELLKQQLRPQEAGGAFGIIDGRMMALTSSLLLPLAASGIGCNGTLSSCSSAEALPNRCMALLSVCQSLPEHPTHVSTTPSSMTTDEGVEDEAFCLLDEFGEVRRACFAIVYDCVFLVAYPSSLFRPLDVALAPGTGAVSSPRCLSDSLGRDLFALCMREVLPSITPLPPTPSEEYEAHFRLASTHNVAASDAWLCVGSLLSLWDQQHWKTRRSAPSCAQPTCEGERGPCSVFYLAGLESTVELHSHCLRTVNELLALLQDKKATVMSNMRLNMITAVCGLAVLLCAPGCSHTNSGSLAPVGALPFATISAVFLVASSTRIQEYASGASCGDLGGINEAAHVLWCLGRLWQEMIQPLPHDALCTFLRLHGKEIAKTISWWTRCVFGPKKRLTPAEPPASASAPFWGSLLELWRPIARTLVQAEQGKALSLTQAQLSVLSELERL
ncbi:conserved hypothetical protein [Leishmania braziliensis MHOM/BR/75/M2904]|uniref:Uncharacterized protein n=1 Tax=Leishmania braziliensis TaxID=5660 RepID=A4HJF1_LEIBR|nr:conserved hypothetical protein [Leishmania braziliensis MHOM/BR/75/M2904]CAJ2477940.1 unnamed protein product [Leishmania braziliensis]CAM42612.2 conserved hypothetical protein [Leishmania braziliensis MHOM/BR/75/M2904]